MQEKQLECRLTQGLKAMGGKAYKFVSPGNAGVPDRIVILPGGVVLFAELKADGGRLSKYQTLQIDALRRLGAEVREVWGENGADSFLRECRERIRAWEAAR